MGWWLLNKNGGIKDFGDGRVCQNAIPINFPSVKVKKFKKDSPDNNYGGDGPADIMGAAVKKIVEEYEAAWGRKPRMTELVGCLGFVTGPLELK